MSTAYLICVWIHIIAACAWVGSMLFFSIVIVPTMRRPPTKDDVMPFVRALGMRYRSFGWTALAILVVTGIGNLYFRGIPLSLLAMSEFWAAGLGRTLAYKLAFIALVLAATATHDAWMRKAIVNGRPAPEADRYRRRASWIGRSTLVFSLVVLFFAVALVRGGI